MMEDQLGNPPPEHPMKSRNASRIFGALLIPASLIAAYYWIVVPVREAQHTGELHYYMKGLLLPPSFLYLGCVLLVADMRDGQFRETGPDGKPKLTSNGRKFIAGLVAVLATTMVIWYFYLRSIGFNALG